MTGKDDGYRAASWFSGRCPLTLNILHDAVKAEDGNIYERNAIMEWIRVNGANIVSRSPALTCDEDASARCELSWPPVAALKPREVRGGAARDGVEPQALRW
jgi:hypothetical protein